MGASSGCGPEPGALDPSLVEFTSDALFEGFELKESLGRMVVVPEPSGQKSRQRITVAVEFETRSELSLDDSGGSVGIYLRLEGPQGLEFNRGCLAAVPDPDYLSCTGTDRLAIALVKSNVFATGDHKIVLSALNPTKTPSSNWWMLETFVGVTFMQAQGGSFQHVRQRGRTAGYSIVQHLDVLLNPASTERSANTLLFVWFRPGAFVEPGGYLELHAAQAFEIACTPRFLLLTMRPGRCRAFKDTSGSALKDVHHVLEVQLSQGEYLLPNREYEFAVSARNPASIVSGLTQTWGLLLRSRWRAVLEANMEIHTYNLTNTGLASFSLTPSTIAPYARNEVRLQLGFSRELNLQTLSEVRIVAADGWDLRPLCSRYQDITGGCEGNCMWQLPYSEERGHHICPQAIVMLLLLDQTKVIRAGTYTLLIAALNPAAQPTRNFWKVSLLSPASNLGWTPNMVSAGANSMMDPYGLRPGQTIVSESSILGFAIGKRFADRTPPPLPLKGDFYEVLSGTSFARPWLAIVALANIVIFAVV